MQAGWDGLFDRVDEGRPGLYRYYRGVVEPLHSQTLRGEVAGPRYQLVVPERFAKSIAISEAAVRAFAKESRVPLPPCLAPEPPAYPARSVASEAEIRKWLDRPEVASLNVRDLWPAAQAHFGERITSRLLKSVRPPRPRGRKKMKQALLHFANN
jgi:hypothetical protein